MKVLVTGGAGFIGSHLVDLLVAKGHDVLILDNLCPQVHPNGEPPEWLNPSAAVHYGDVRNPQHVDLAVEGQDAVVHLAAAVGVGQAQYELSNYVDNNVTGTANVLEACAKHGVKSIFIAGSMSCYGEGLYMGNMGPFRGHRRVTAEPGNWNPEGVFGPLKHRIVPIPEHELDPQGVYALTKAWQEQLALEFAQIHKDVRVTVGRFFNVLGPRQALSNPYTGVAAIFTGALLRGDHPLVYEDGEQRRDFIHVADVASAVLTMLDDPRAKGVYNVSTGLSTSIHELASALSGLLDLDLPPKVTGQFRSGDVRACIGDSTRLKGLGWTPKHDLSEALQAVIDWAGDETPEGPSQQDAHTALVDMGLLS